jgi:hypothetical protein
MIQIVFLSIRLTTLSCLSFQEHSFRQKRNSLSVLHENEILRQENATHDIVENWLQTTTSIHAQIRKPQFNIGSSSNSDSSFSASNSPQTSPRNCDTNAPAQLLGNQIAKDHVIESETIRSEDAVDGRDVSETCDKSEMVGANLADEAFRQSVSELSGYSRCSPHRRFSLDASLLAAIQRKPFILPYSASSQEEQSGAKDKTDTEQIKPSEINTTADEIEKESIQSTEQEIPKAASVETNGSDVGLARLGRRQSFDFTSTRAGPPQLINLPRRASFSGVAPTPRTTYQKSYTLSGCKTKFNFPSPMHAVLMNRQKVVLSEDDNDCVVSSSGSDTADTFSRSSETLYDTDSQVHDQLYNILSQDDSLANHSKKNSLREEKASSRNETKANNVSKREPVTQNVSRQRSPSVPFIAPRMGADQRRATFDMGNIRGFSNNTRRASVGEVVVRGHIPPPVYTQETAPPPLKPRMQKSNDPRPDRDVPSNVANTNKNPEARNTEEQSKPRGQVNNFPRSRGSVDTAMNSYGHGGNIARSRGSIDSVMSTMSSVDSPRYDAEPSAYSTPRFGSQNIFPRSRNPCVSDMSVISPTVVADKGPQVRRMKSSRDSNNNGTDEDNNELRISDDSLKFSRCGSPDSLFDRPPPVPEKRFSLRSEAADSGFASSCMSLLTTSSGYSYKAKGGYDPKLSIASIEEGYISSQSTDSPKQKHHSHKLSIQSDCSFMSTGSSYFAEDELSEDEHDHSDQTEDGPPRPEHFGRVNSENSFGKSSRNVEVNRISCASEAKRLDSKGDMDSKPTLRKASNTLSDFRQILHENKKNHNKSVNVQSPSPGAGRRHSLPTSALCPQSALRQKYLFYNNDMAQIQDTSI